MVKSKLLHIKKVYILYKLLHIYCLYRFIFFQLYKLQIKILTSDIPEKSIDLIMRLVANDKTNFLQNISVKLDTSVDKTESSYD